MGVQCSQNYVATKLSLLCLITFPCFSQELALRCLEERIELEDAMHWLSTLGGAYSNLGEHSLAFVSI